MFLNIQKKCKFSDVIYNMNGKKLEGIVQEKYLGVKVANNMSWQAQIDMVKSECYKKLDVIRRIFKHCNMEIKEKLYNHLVKQTLDYCCTVWSLYLIGQVKTLEKIQKRPLKLFQIIMILMQIMLTCCIIWTGCPYMTREFVSRQLIMLYKVILWYC